MNQELLSSLEYIEKEKGISKPVLLEALKQALISACRKTYPDDLEAEFNIEIDPITYSIHLLRNGKPLDDPDFGRIAAQTAKQVIIQKIREAERESIFDDFSAKQGEIVSGTVHRVERKAIIVDLGKTEGILPAREQATQDVYRQGDLIRAYVLEVKKTSRGPEIILSRSHPGLVQRLFELEVPEIHEKIVEVKGVVREAGSRTKFSVFSSDEKIDCVGSCVGIRGQRVKNIVRELVGEKIDIVRYSEDIDTYIRNAMAPAELSEIKLDRENQSAEIFVRDDQLSLAIGKKGQNVRLASKLLNLRLDVRSLSQKVPLSELEGVGAKTEGLLKEGGIQSVKDLLKSTPEELSKIPGIGPKTAEKLIEAAQKAIIGQGNGSGEKDLLDQIKKEKKVSSDKMQDQLDQAVQAAESSTDSEEDDSEDQLQAAVQQVEAAEAAQAAEDDSEDDSEDRLNAAVKEVVDAEAEKKEDDDKEDGEKKN